jgi:hypothetical protein
MIGDAPNPKTAPDWREWAEQMLRYLDATDGREGEVLPAPVLLQHQDATIIARAVTDGLMMFAPTVGRAGSAVLSVGAEYKQMALGDIPVHAVVVYEAAQLAGVLDSSKVYLIDGTVDMGLTQIVVPQGGLNVRGLGFGVSNLFSDEDNYTMFIDDGVFSGDLFLDRIDIEVSGANSKVFDLDNDENSSAVECTTVNFLNCTELGVLDSYRQGLWLNVALIGCVDGLTMTGAWAGGFATITAIIVGGPTPTFTGTLFKAGIGLTIGGSFRSDMNALGLNDSGEFCDFAPANITDDGQFFMGGVRTNPNSVSFPNMPADDVKARYTNCVGTDNTYVGGVIEISTAATTTITVSDTLTLMAGLGTAGNLAWMAKTGDAALIYESEQAIDIDIVGALSFSGSNNKEMAVQVRQWDDSASAYINIGPEFIVTLNGGPAGTRAENVSFGGFGRVEIDDRIELWIKNKTDTTNITTSVGGQMRVAER